MGMTKLPHQLPENGVEILANLREHLQSHPPSYDFFLILSETNFDFSYRPGKQGDWIEIYKRCVWVQSRVFETLLNNPLFINPIISVRHLISPIGGFMLKRNERILFNLKSECMKELIESYFVVRHIESCIPRRIDFAYALSFYSCFPEDEENFIETHKYKTNINGKELILDVDGPGVRVPDSYYRNQVVVNVIDLSEQTSKDLNYIKSNLKDSYITKDYNEVIHIVSDFVFKNNSYVLFNPFNNIWKDPVLSLEYYNEIKQLLGIMVENFGKDDKKNFLFKNKILPQNISSKIRYESIGSRIENSPFLDDTKLKFYYDYINQTKNNGDVISPKIFILE